ncbi:MAG: acyl-CoA dehydrogenase family protein [Betaproteobacteria bacterium]|nr:acyl-CoA dehydrogenase family protein [Betaproteobacteria bacterium]
MTETSNFTADDERMLLDAIDNWVEKSVKPIAREHDHEDKYPHALVEEMKELGLFGATIGQQYGGLGLPASVYAKIVTRVSSVWMAPTGIFNSHLIMAAAIERAGTEEQKKKYLPRMASGELRGGLGLTEPDCGTDLQAIRTVAKKDGDHYVVNGNKIWITNSGNGGGILLLVKTDPLAFQDYRVHESCLLGGVEGKGFQQAVGGLELGRINIAARGAGIAEGATRLAVRYAQERKTFGKPICEHQAIQLKLGEMATQVEAAKLLVESAARAYDSGQRCDMEAGMAKYFASEAGVFCASEAMRIFGGASYSVEYEIERFYRDAMLMCIGEGTNEMQRIIIAKQLVERNRV